MNFPKIKAAIEMAYICGLVHMDEAILNWDRSLSHGAYSEIPTQVAAMKAELAVVFQTIERNNFYGLTIQEANEALSICIDFEEQDKQLENISRGIPRGCWNSP